MFFFSRFNIKLFMVREAAIGYIWNLSIYTGKDPRDLLKGHVTLDADCPRIAKLSLAF